MVCATDDYIRVLVCADHALFRRGLVTALEEDDGIEVVAEAANGHEAVELACALTPDVVLMDVHMPNLDGIAAAARILEAIPTVNVLMLSVSDEEDDLFAALRAGAAGHLRKETSTTDVCRAVRDVHVGARLITPPLATRLLVELAAVDEPALSEREVEILRRLAAGAAPGAAAAELRLEAVTVRNHVRNALEKLRLHARMQAAAAAAADGR